MVADSCSDVWSFLGPESEKTWYGIYSDKPDGDLDKTAERMMFNFEECGHPFFLAKQRNGKEVYSLQR